MTLPAPRVNIGKIRRDQIVEAAVAIIHEQGIENLSLSAIEKKAELSRGQLTYYFRAKEDILLAVFDRMLALMRARAVSKEDNPLSLAHKREGWERLGSLLQLFVLTPPSDPAFHSLMYTFLAQMLHREDYRLRLAGLFEEWRAQATADAAVELAGQQEKKASARTVASLIQAIIHGLFVQRNADPDSFDPAEMLQLILHLLGSYLRPDDSHEKPSPRKTNHPKRAASGPRQPRRGRTSPGGKVEPE
jgi:AcrR family transcriptional regulator